MLKAGEQAHASGDVGGEALARALIGRCLLAVRDTARALDESMVALQLAESAEQAEPRQHSLSLHAAQMAMSAVYLYLEQPEISLDHCQRALACATDLGDAVAMGVALDTMACVHSVMASRARASGESEKAEQLERDCIRGSAEAARLHRSGGHVVYESNALTNEAEAMGNLGEHDQALALLEELAGRSNCDTPYVKTHILDARGGILMQLGRPAEARRLFEEAVSLQARAEAALAYAEHLAQACEAMGDIAAALHHYKRFHALYVETAAESAQRSARVAAVQLKTAEVQARADGLERRNSQLNRRADDLKRQSLEDALTGLPNRRQLDQLLAEVPTRYAVAMLDLDHFKQVNDTHSHAVGDEVLRCLGGLLRSTCRAADTPARYGGEEFVVLMPGIDTDMARGLAERLRRAVQAFDWGRVVPGLAVTVSIGVAGAAEATSAQALLALADQRLYAAKRGGRNRVVSA